MSVDFDQIKKSTDIVAVIQRHGIELKKQGADYVGLCPFHDDHNPSMRVSQGKGLFHCMSCGAAGNAIQFVAKKESLTVKEAALRLMGNMPGVQRGSDVPLPSPVQPASHPQLFNAVIEHYRKALLGRDHRGFDYLKKRGLGDTATLAHFKVGFVDGTLKSKLTPAQVKLAQEMGLFNDKRNEKFWQRVVVPIYDEAGQPVGLCGRDITGEMQHKYLKARLLVFAHWLAQERGKEDPRDVTLQDLLDFHSALRQRKRKLTGEPISANYCNTHLYALRGYYRFLFETGRILVDPCAELPRLRGRSPRLPLVVVVRFAMMIGRP
jgi:CHC2-type zinc finger protein/DNA primase-like protein